MNSEYQTPHQDPYVLLFMTDIIFTGSLFHNVPQTIVSGIWNDLGAEISGCIICSIIKMYTLSLHTFAFLAKSLDTFLHSHCFFHIIERQREK